MGRWVDRGKTDTQKEKAKQKQTKKDRKKRTTLKVFIKTAPFSENW